jgi:sulfur carrier protein ThiS
MIKFRTKVMSESAVEVSFIENEKILSLVERTIKEKLNWTEVPPETLDYFVVVLNGHMIEREFWDSVILHSSDEVLIAPRIKGGSFGQIFKQIAIIAVTLVSAAYLGPGGAAGFGALAGAASVAAITVGATLILNALIPPPNAGSDLGGFGAADIENSQMYSISSQSNQLKPYGFVPRVYGIHRVFPNLAATPYTTIEADSATGGVSQYFHAIYDFGFGPLVVSDIRIGDTPLTEYADVSYRLVDLNLPAVAEGPWDESLESEFTLYKGDNQRDGTSVVLNRNRSASLATDLWRATRNAAPNTSGLPQTITLDFVCPQGLIAFGADGSRVDRTIELRVEFSKVGEDIWRGFADLEYVSDFDLTGGRSGQNYRPLADYSPSNADNYPPESALLYFDSDTILGYGSPGFRETGTYFGYPAGTTELILPSGIQLLSQIREEQGRKVLGRVTEEVSIGGGFSRYTLDTPLRKRINVISRGVVQIQDWAPIINTFPLRASGTFTASAPLTTTFRITGREQSARYATISFTPRERASYKVRITREQSYSSSTFQVVDALTLYTLSTRFDREPVLTEKRHVFLEIKVKATNQLNGSIQNLNAVCASVLDAYEGGVWTKKVTNNPAWVFADLLTGEANKRPISKDRLAVESLVEWAEFCDEIPTSDIPDFVFVEPRFTCNFVLDYQTTLQQVLSAVSNAAQASLNVIDGKYGVLLDINRTTPVQIFTPRNSWGFNSSRNYFDPPNALKVRFISVSEEWQTTEAIVYDEGFDADTAETFDELSSFACTSLEQATRFGRYMMAQARLRQETIGINVDFEYLVCTRGDYVQLSQDVMRVGGRPARVKTVVGNRITIDDDLETLPMTDYGYNYRGADGNIATDTLTVIGPDTFDLDGDIPSPGDLIVIGEVGKVVIDCIVKSIQPSGDLTAQLTLVEKADAVYLAERGGPIPVYTAQLNRPTTGNSAPGAIEDLEVIENTWRVIGTSYQYYIDLDWGAPIGPATDTYEVYVNTGNGYDLFDVTKESEYEYIVNPVNLNVEHFFKVLAVSATGEKISLVDAMEVSATPLRKITPPSNVQALNLNITGEVLQLDWVPPTDPDILEYLIRYNPNTTGATWSNTIPLVRVDRNTTLTSVQARTGSYLIKAVDFNGNESVIPARGITSIPELFNLNIIEETNDFPMLVGAVDRVAKANNELFLDTIVAGGPTVNEYYSEGFYYYEDLLDLGEIYTVRLQSAIEAEGFTIGDLMSEWNPLSEVEVMSGSRTDEWDVETQVRYTDEINVMSSWGTLSEINPIGAGDESDFTPWVKFIMGDFTGRIFQFRLKLVSNKASVTPRVFDGVIKADMPDRLFSLNNIVSNVGATLVEYDPPFAGPGTSPNIQITQDSAQNGDYYQITDKTLSNFTITFYDNTDSPVSRQFDVTAKGYGRKANQVI